MRRIVEIVRTRDGTYYLRVGCIDTNTGELIVNTLIPFKRLVTAIDTASLLQIHIDNIETLPIKQYLGG